MPALTPRQVELVELLFDSVYERLKTRALGPKFGSRMVAFQFKPELSLPGLFTAAAASEGARPDPHLMNSLLQVAERHLNSQKDTLKAQVIRAVDAFLRGDPKADLVTVLGGELRETFKTAMSNTRRILDTESSNVRNAGALSGVMEVSATMGIEDPVIYFVTVRDNFLCAECARLHLLDDGVTPRVWRTSEIGHGYHRRGQGNPKIGGLHPHCRCSLVTLMPGYGFEDGRVTYIGRKHDELAAQRGENQDDLKKAQKTSKPWYYRQYPVDTTPHSVITQAVDLVRTGLNATAADAGLPQPLIHFTTKPLGDHLARYMKGSMNAGQGPVFVLNAAEHYHAVQSAGADHEAVAATSLYHELGHAICAHYRQHPMNEEDMVENFANTCYTQGGDIGLHDLHTALGVPSPKP